MSEEQEPEVIVETEEETQAEAQESPEKVEEPAQESGESELDSYSKGVQSRIKKLTEKYRQEERDKAEAVRLSQQLIEENKKLKTRVQSLDSGYLNEYGNRLESQTVSAKQLYKEAHESGDTDKMLEAQELISKIAVEKQRYASAKTKAEQQAKLQVQRQRQQQQPQAQAQPQAQPQQAPPDPKAQAWAEKNAWFGDDRVMTMAAFAINQQLIEEEGFDPQTDEYYTAIDSRIRSEFPHKFETPKKSGGGSQVASAGNSASRSTKQGRRSVKLTHSQVAIAKKLGVPLEEYAKYVKD
ncbi:hypothetical protein OAA16_00615 [Candidatus Pelagibacter sp.]|nr:hypothetical protein [Candidatus Pelagibacter sp.]